MHQTGLSGDGMTDAEFHINYAWAMAHASLAAYRGDEAERHFVRACELTGDPAAAEAWRHFIRSREPWDLEAMPQPTNLPLFVAEGYLLRAGYAVQAGKREEARRLARIPLAACQSRHAPDLAVRVAFHYLWLNDSATARRVADTVEPAGAETMFLAAQLFLFLGENQRVLDILERLAKERAPSAIQVRVGAQALLGLGKAEEAWSRLEGWLRHPPDAMPCTADLMDFHLQRGLVALAVAPHAAESAFRQAMSALADLPAYVLSWSALLPAAQGRAEEALAQQRRAIELANGRSSLNFNLALCLALAGQWELAAEEQRRTAAEHGHLLPFMDGQRPTFAEVTARLRAG